MKWITQFVKAVLMIAILNDLAVERLKAGQMQASDGATNDEFGFGVSVFGSIGLGGARLDDFTGPPSTTNQGSAYIFRNLNTASGTINENAKLVASDGASNDQFGRSVSISSTIGLVGAHLDDTGGTANHGSAYVFRNLDTATGTVNQNAKLVASDAATNDQFGISVSISGTIGLIGAHLDDTGGTTNHGSAYVFRNLDTATGTVNQNAKLVASDAATEDRFGVSVAISGTIGLIGAHLDDTGTFSNNGSAYVFRNLDTITGTVTENAKLVASDAANNDQFGISVSISGTIGLIGAHLDDTGGTNNHGSAYVFRNLDTVTGTVTQSAKLVASDFAANDQFGFSVSVSGTTGIVGAHLDDIGTNADQGSAYIFRNLDTASGTINQSVKIIASNGATSDRFGVSVSLDGDRFVIGSYFRDVGTNTNQGVAYFGHVRTFTIANLGSDSTSTDGLSFISRENWIIGQTTDNNIVTLTSGDSGNVTHTGTQVYVGQNSGSDGNTLHIESGATLTSNSINVGASGNSGNQLRANGTISLTSGATLTIADDNILSGAGTIQGTGSAVVINGSLRPGSGDLGSGISTLTRNNGDVTWNGSSTSAWVFELGAAQPTMAQANTGGTRDLLDITAGNFTKGTGSDFIFDFASTGVVGWYKLVDWTGSTTFVAADFTATNLPTSILSYTFVIDDGGGSTTALYIHLVPEPQVWALLSAVLGALIVIRQRLRKAARAKRTLAA
jgi:NAD dependent epimerase/dehydratase family enzyme